jgi:hypothetical protein
LSCGHISSRSYLPCGHINPIFGCVHFAKSR